MPFLELDGKSASDDNPYELTAGGEVMVGSGSHATWRIPGRDLAARHFRVSVEGDGTVTVTPASPQNVVVLNGKQLPPTGTDLASGDVIGAGSARFIYLARRDAPRPPAPPSQDTAHLILAGARKGYTLRRRVVQIGRESGCSIVLKDPSVSRFHADIRAECGTYALYSMGSAGTRVNGQPVVAPRLLQEGDQIQIGDTTFRFSRQPLPPDFRSVQFEDHEEDALSRRNTQMARRTVTAEAPRIESVPRQSVKQMPYLIGVGMLVVGVVTYLVLR